MAKKRVKKTIKKELSSGETCNSHKCCGFCSWILPILIVILVWWKSAETWSQIIITIAALILLLGRYCPCKCNK